VTGLSPEKPAPPGKNRGAAAHVKPIRIFQHHPWVGPGQLLNFLRKRVPCEVVALDKGEPVPQCLNDVSGLVFLGADYGVNDYRPWLADELRLIRKAAERNFPVLGHCFGAQLISKALGGRIRPMPRWEIGWHPVRIADRPALCEWCDPELAQGIPVMFWHKDNVALPRGATPLLGTEFQPIQAFARGTLLALGPHLEATPRIVRGWLQIYGPEMPPPSTSVQGSAEILRGLQDKARAMHRLGRQFYRRWLAQVFGNQKAAGAASANRRTA